jgi:hypothetical protein
MQVEEQREILRDWLRHPGTRLMASKLRAAAKGLLRKYDSADPETFQRIQVSRWFLNYELPRVIESVMNSGEEEPAPEEKWTFFKWLLRR